MELNGWTSPQMLPRYGASARAARARRTYDRIMAEQPDPGQPPPPPSAHTAASRTAWCMTVHPDTPATRTKGITQRKHLRRPLHE